MTDTTVTITRDEYRQLIKDSVEYEYFTKLLLLKLRLDYGGRVSFYSDDAETVVKMFKPDEFAARERELRVVIEEGKDA